MWIIHIDAWTKSYQPQVLFCTRILELNSCRIPYQTRLDGIGLCLYACTQPLKALRWRGKVGCLSFHRFVSGVPCNTTIVWSGLSLSVVPTAHFVNQHCTYTTNWYIWDHTFQKLSFRLQVQSNSSNHFTIRISQEKKTFLTKNRTLIKSVCWFK